MAGVNAWVDRHGWKIVGLVAAGAIAWTTLKAQVAQKADKSEVAEIHAELKSIREEMQAIRKTLDQQHRYLCRGKEEQIGCQP